MNGGRARNLQINILHHDDVGLHRAKLLINTKRFYFLMLCGFQEILLTITTCRISAKFGGSFENIFACKFVGCQKSFAGGP